MTFGPAHILGVALARPVTLLPGWRAWPRPLQALYTYAIGAHLAHALDFGVALLFYHLVWLPALPAAAEGLAAAWVARVVAFNLAAMVLLVGSWHAATHGGAAAGSDVAAGPLAEYKYNKVNPYGPAAAPDGNLRREVLLQTLGWLQAAALQCAFLRLYATRTVVGGLAYAPFWAGGPPLSLASLAHPATQWNVACVLAVTYWREVHFYLCHRGMHPWSAEGAASAGRRGPWWDGGGLLYRVAHSWHHKSTNPGPWSGLSMHPLEHALYFSCAYLLPLAAGVAPALAVHPMVFLYCLFHACVAPIAGHDGHAAPGGGSDYHYLHHARALARAQGGAGAAHARASPTYPLPFPPFSSTSSPTYPSHSLPFPPSL